MASIIERLCKRRCYPVSLPNGEKIFVRALTLGELQAVDSLPPELATPFSLGCALVDDAGNPELPRGVVQSQEKGGGPMPESNLEYAQRMIQALAGMPTDSLMAAAEAIGKLQHTPSVEELAKN